MEEAEYCHRLALMNRGRIIALDEPHDLKGAIQEPILEVTTADAPRAVEVIRGAAGVLEVTMFGRAVHVMVENQARAEREIPELLAGAGHVVESIQSIEPSLEDVFVSFVHRSGGTAVS
jgi:ABC-2 type transport system ATP-binding protein